MKKLFLFKLLAIVLTCTINSQLISFTISHLGEGIAKRFTVSIATGERNTPARKDIVKDELLIEFFGVLVPNNYTTSDLPLRVTLKDDNNKEYKILIDANFFGKDKKEAIDLLNDPYKVNLSFGIFKDKNNIPEGITQFEDSSVGAKLTLREQKTIDFIKRAGG